MNYILIFISAAFVNNIVLSQFLGIESLLGESKKIQTTIKISAAIAFVMIIVTIITHIIQKYILAPFKLEFLQTVVFILIIVSLAQLLEITLKKFVTTIYEEIENFLPLIITNSVILGVIIIVGQNNFSLLESFVFSTSTAFGFGLTLVIFAAIRNQLSMVNLPKAMEGAPILLLTAGLLAMAFMGFIGIVK